VDILAQEQLLNLGIYPAVGLAEARENAMRSVSSSAVILEWHRKLKAGWSDHHADRVLQRLEANVFPWLGDKPIREVTSDDIVSCIDRMVERNAVDTARRVLQLLKKLCKWAIARGLLTTSPVAHIDAVDHLPAIKIQHRAAIKDAVQLGALRVGSAMPSLSTSASLSIHLFWSKS
jgi:integrase